MKKTILFGLFCFVMFGLGLMTVVSSSFVISVAEASDDSASCECFENQFDTINYFEQSNIENFSIGQRRIYGGDPVWTGLAGLSTITANAVHDRTGRFGVLMSGHSISRNGEARYNILGGSIIGRATQWQNSGTVDAAFVEFSNQNDFRINSFARHGSTTHTNIRLGDNSMILTGQSCSKNRSVSTIS